MSWSLPKVFVRRTIVGITGRTQDYSPMWHDLCVILSIWYSKLQTNVYFFNVLLKLWFYSANLIDNIFLSDYFLSIWASKNIITISEILKLTYLILDPAHYKLTTHSRKPVPASEYPSDHTSPLIEPKQQFSAVQYWAHYDIFFKCGLYWNKVEKVDDKQDNNDKRYACF